MTDAVDQEQAVTAPDAQAAALAYARQEHQRRPFATLRVSVLPGDKSSPPGSDGYAKVTVRAL